MGANLQFVQFKVIREKSKRYECKRIIKSPEDAEKLLRAIGLHELPEERFYIIALTTKNKVDAIIPISQGGVNIAHISPREIFSKALLVNAVKIILAHNHPSGDPTASLEDISMTKKLYEAGKMMNIEVLDHIILGDENFVSLKETI